MTQYAALIVSLSKKFCLGSSSFISPFNVNGQIETLFISWADCCVVCCLSLTYLLKHIAHHVTVLTSTVLVDLAITGRKGSHDSFEVTKQARLVPKFEEANVDGYFAHFERTALNLGWLKECWSMLLQTVLTGKAQRAYATLPTENCADYDLVKAAVLKSFELVPEA